MKIFNSFFIMLLILTIYSQAQLINKGDIVGPPPPPPDVPTLLSPDSSSIIFDQIPIFDWSDSQGAISYTILVDNDFDFNSPEIDQSPVESTYIPESNLGTETYYWKVLATNSTGSSNYSDPWTFTIDPPSLPTPPIWPINPIQVIGNDVILTWELVDGMTEYPIYRSDDPNGVYEYIGISYSNTYVDEGASLLSDHFFYYLISSNK